MGKGDLGGNLGSMISLTDDGEIVEKKKGDEGRKRKRKQQREEKPAGIENIKAYKRPVPKVDVKNIKDKKLKSSLKKKAYRANQAAFEAARSEILLPEEQGFLEPEGLERSYHFKQEEIKDAVDVSSSRKVFDLEFEKFGPYAMRYTNNGRHLLIGGAKGHVASFDWKTGKLGCELQLGETVRDVTWLHDQTMFAVAQRRFTYVYDASGAEVYVLRKHVDPLALEFLPYHFLLASVGNSGWLKYYDTSVGKHVVEHRTRMGPCRVMRQNPYNGVLHLGHNNGCVTLWTPNMSSYAVKQLCHRGPLTAVAVDRGGHYMATAGADGQMKIWDIRKFTDKPLQAYFSPNPATCLDISQKGLLAVGHGPHVQVWKDAFLKKQQSPYMGHMIAGSKINQCRFSAFEDVLGLGHKKGISSILVPGSGEPNFDAREANPFETSKQRKETEVRQLMEKIPSELITLNPNEILRVARGEKVEEDVNEAEEDAPTKEKNRKRGRNSSTKRIKRKQKNVVDQKRVDMIEVSKRKKERMEKEKRAAKQPPTTLDRFGRRL